MNLTQPQALIFDCDGTLADTMPLHWQAWQTVTRRYGLDFSEERFYTLGGVPSRDILAMLSAEQNRPLDALAASQEKEAAYIPHLPEVRPIEPVVRIVRENAGKLPMAVASGGNQTHINEVLTHLGLRQFFQAVVTSEAVKRQKPAPDIFLEAARRLGVLPQFCRAYEDTDLGLQAIRAAGMEAVDVRPLTGKGL
jgi:beta-phosphoglucomutase family hydrolase